MFFQFHVPSNVNFRLGVFENYAGIFPAKGTPSEYSRILIVTDSQQVRIGLAVFALKMFFFKNVHARKYFDSKMVYFSCITNELVVIEVLSPPEGAITIVRRH